MELYIVIIGIGLSLVLNVVALVMVREFLDSAEMTLVYHLILLKDIIVHEHKRTRKKTQEVKVRLTKVRRDVAVVKKNI